jgi:hypothetical protein
METKTHWKKVFNKDYLGACDLEDNKDLKAIISHVEIREIKGANGKQKRNIAIFTDKKIKPMVLNVTNCKLIKKFTNSTYIEDWQDVSVQIYVKGNVEAFGDTTEGLRFRDFQPKNDKPKLLPNTEQWSKAVTYLKGTGTIERIKRDWDISEENELKLKDEVLA